MIKDRLKTAGIFLKKNWYGAILTVSGFLMATEVLGTWAGAGVPFLCIFGYAIWFMTRTPKA